MTDRKLTAPSSAFEAYRPSDERAGNQSGGPNAPHTAHRTPSPPPARKRMGAGLILVLLALAGLGAAIATFLIAVPPAALVENEIVSAVKARTGRDLVIAGPSSFSVFPALGLVMRDVSLSGPPGMKGGALVTMTNLEVNVAFWPLLRREVEIERLVLGAPAFDMRIDKEGRKSWDFSAAETASEVRFAEVGPPPGVLRDIATETGAADARDRRNGEFGRLALGNVRIENGALRYRDERNGWAHDVSSITMDITPPSTSRSLSATGSAIWSGQTLTFNGALERFAALGDEQPSQLSFNVVGQQGTASFDGTFTLDDAPALKGAISAKGSSTRALADWLGSELSWAGSPFTIAGKIETAPRLVKLEDANLDIGGMAATGRVSVETGGKRPFWRADLKIAEMDFNKYGARPEGSDPDGQPAASPSAAPSAPARIDDLLRGEGPKVKGWRAGWSEEPIDWSFLGAADADLKLGAGRILHKDVKTGPAEIEVSLDNERLKATIRDVALYGGRGQGVVTVNGTAEGTTIGATVTADNIDARAFLADAADLDWLSGRAQVSLVLAGQGTSERRIVETLSGTANVKLIDGAIAGIDAGKILDDLSDGRIGEARQKPGGETGFSEMTASFAIKAGVAENRDLRIKSPLLNATGAGKVLLAKREIDYTIRPQLAGNPDGRNGDEEPSALEIPVRVRGSWDKPKFTPDLDGVLKEPGKAVSAIKEIGKKLKGNKKLGDFVRGLLGDEEGERGSEEK